MDQYGMFPAHPQRSTPEPRPQLGWSTSAFVAWLVALVCASVFGVLLSIATVPDGQDLFETPVLYLSIFALAIPCAFAGWFVPRAAPYWGLVIAPPYLLGFGWMTTAHPAIGADLSVFGLLFLLLMMIVPAGFALATGLSRRTLSR
jgi:hypothetical protein